MYTEGRVGDISVHGGVLFFIMSFVGVMCHWFIFGAAEAAGKE
jgi:hypothetical protein